MQHSLKLGVEGNLPMNALLRSEKEFKLRCRPSILHVGRKFKQYMTEHEVVNKLPELKLCREADCQGIESFSWGNGTAGMRWSSFWWRNWGYRRHQDRRSGSPQFSPYSTSCGSTSRISSFKSSRDKLVWLKRLYNLLCSFEIRPNKLDRYIRDSGVEHRHTEYWKQWRSSQPSHEYSWSYSQGILLRSGANF